MKNTVRVGKIKIQIPEYFVPAGPLPDDPKDSQSFMAQTAHAVCYARVYPVSGERLLPRDKETLLGGIRYYLSDKQGIICVECGEDYVYSIVKTLQEPSGTQYTLTYQKFRGNSAAELHAFFEETAASGMRESALFEYCSKKGLVGTDTDPREGWEKDPYDENLKKGALMNMSEDEQYDTMFPDYPLSLCRGFVRTLLRES